MVLLLLFLFSYIVVAGFVLLLGVTNPLFVYKKINIPPSARSIQRQLERQMIAEYKIRQLKMRELEHQRVEDEKISALRQIELKRKLEDEEKFNQYRQLRKAIEAMPQYSLWRQDVLNRFGKKCAICGSTDNIEVDHRYKSFYAIIKQNNIMNTIQAYECHALWDINNGAPLCKAHHDKTKSSMYYRERNNCFV